MEGNEENNKPLAPSEEPVEKSAEQGPPFFKTKGNLVHRRRVGRTVVKPRSR